MQPRHYHAEADNTAGAKNEGSCNKAGLEQESERYRSSRGVVAPAGSFEVVDNTPAGPLSATDDLSDRMRPSPSARQYQLTQEIANIVEPSSVGSSSASSPSASAAASLAASGVPVAGPSTLPTLPGRQSRRATDARPPRPPNAFILFRSDQARLFKSDPSTPALTQSKLSQLIADKWRNESPRTKEWYKQYAELKKRDHAAAYPGYRYVPRREKTEESDGEESTSSTSSRPSLVRGYTSPTFGTFVGVPGQLSQSRSTSSSARDRELGLPGRLRNVLSNPTLTTFTSTVSTTSTALDSTPRTRERWRHELEPPGPSPGWAAQQDQFGTYPAPFQLSPLSQELPLHDMAPDQHFQQAYYASGMPADAYVPVDAGVPYAPSLRLPRQTLPLPELNNHTALHHDTSPTGYQAEEYTTAPLYYYGTPESYHPHSAPPTLSSFSWVPQREHATEHDSFFPAQAYNHQMQAHDPGSVTNDGYVFPPQASAGNSLHVHLSDVHR